MENLKPTGGNTQNTKDWTGNKAATFVTLAASNHSEGERQVNDYYATEPKAMELLLAEESFAPVIWECACGEGHLSRVLEEHGFEVISTDLIYRGFGDDEPECRSRRTEKGGKV